MTDLFTAPMPAELAEKIDDARQALLDTATAIDAALGRFLAETWAACQRTYEYENGAGERITAHETPDFNAFDRMTSKYAQQVSKIRWMLWDLSHEAEASASQPTKAP